MRVTIKKALKITLSLLFFMNTITSQANPIDLFSSDWNEEKPLVVFHYKAGDVDYLHHISLSFFAVDDCQQAHLASYKTPLDKPISFPIKPAEDFALMSAITYQIANQLLTQREINDIHSVLIRFKGNLKEFPRFLGGCTDEGTNCCISIQCSNEGGICLPQYTIPRQTFILFSNYDHQ